MDPQDPPSAPFAARLDALVKQRVTGIVEAEASGRLTLANPRWCQMLGRTEAEVLGAQLTDFLHPESAPPMQEALKRLAAGGPDFEADSLVLRRDGEALPVATSIHALRGSRGEYRGFIAVVLDLTERRRAERALGLSEQRLSADLAGMTRLYQLNERVAHARGLNEVLQEVLAVAVEFTHAQRGNIQLLDENGETLRIAVLQGHGAAFIEHFAAHGGGFPCNAVMQSKQRIVIEDIEAEDALAASTKLAAMRADGIRAMQATPLLSRDGRMVGVLSTHFDTARRPTRDALRRLDLLAWMAGDQIERAQAAATLADDLRDTRVLQELSSRMVAVGDIRVLYEEILAAAVTLTQADAGTVQIFEERTQELMLLASYGFDAAMVTRFARVDAASTTSCGRALATGKREFMDFDSGGEDPHGDLAAHVAAGYRSAQATPMVARSGSIVGMINTHWRERRRPAARELGFLGLLARQAADLVEGKRIEREMQEVARNKDEFLAMLSHELRNPLAPIVHAVRALKRLQPLTPEVEEMRAMIEQQSRQLTRLVDDLLDVARITQGRIELHPAEIELAEVISRAVDAARPTMDERRHRLTISQPGWVRVRADAERLAQAISNVLHNAAKYTDPGGEIQLRAEVAGNDVEIRVKDNGMGISPSDLPHIFELFRQSDRSLDRAEGGLGIGLTLVRRMAEMHGGTVRAESAGVGEGSEVIFRLPIALQRTRTAPAAARAPLPPPGSPLRILVVDDNEAVAKSTAMLLKFDGHEVRTAADGVEAIAMARGLKPALVLLDIGLPGRSGYDVARDMRADPALKGMTLVAVTGYGRAEDRRKAMEAGFDRHLTKPVSGEELEAVISMARAGAVYGGEPTSGG